MVANIHKEADFLGGLWDQVSKHTNFSKAPFETLFGTVGISILFGFSPILGALAFIGELFGYGPGLIGKIIDKQLGFGSSKPQINDASISSAAGALTNYIMGNAKKAGNLNDYIVKNASQETIIKTARFGLIDFVKKLLGLGRGGLKKTLVLWLKRFAYPLIGLGIAGGVKSVVKEKFTGKPDTFNDKLYHPMGYDIGDAKLYAKYKGENPLNILIGHLNNDGHWKEKIKAITQSKTYNKDVLKQRMENLRQEVMRMSHLNPAELKERTKFLAPPISKVSEMLIPEVEYNKVKKELK